MDMTGIIGVISYGLGTVIGFFLVGVLVFWFIQDVMQKKHTVLRNYPSGACGFSGRIDEHLNILIQRPWPREARSTASARRRGARRS